MHTTQVGLEAKASCHEFEDMGVGIDQSGRHQLAARIDHLARRCRGNGWLDCRDPSRLDRQITDRINTVRRINHMPAAHNKIVVLDRSLRSVQGMKQAFTKPRLDCGRQQDRSSRRIAPVKASNDSDIHDTLLLLIQEVYAAREPYTT